MRLSRATLKDLPAPVKRPGFDPRGLVTGIVHLGIGAFQRAHQAAYTQPLLARDPGWGILGVSLRRADTRDALAPQDCLYTIAERDGAGESLEVMVALTGVLVAPEDPRAVVARLADPAVRIVTITVTEKGYCRDTATGSLNEDDPAIRRDLAAPETPTTLPGLIVAAQRVLARYAALLDPALGDFVESEVACPSAMVDRIVPATTDADRARIAASLGAEDAWPVVCEPFRQWVIEDRFPLGRPAWEETGATLVSDVRPYEEMKLRLLNGSHSTIAYLGRLAGWETVADAMAEPALAAHVAALMREVATTLHLPPGMDLKAYQRSLIERFANPALNHKTAQIAMDGSQKLPQRLFAPVLDRLKAGRSTRRIALGVAAWLRFLQGRSDKGLRLRVDDPMAERLMAAAGAAADSRALTNAIFALREIVPPDLAASQNFRDDIVAALDLIATHGVTTTLHRWND